MGEKLKFVAIEINDGYSVVVGDDGRFGLEFNRVVAWEDDGTDRLSEKQLKSADWLVGVLNQALDVEADLSL